MIVEKSESESGPALAGHSAVAATIYSSTRMLVFGGEGYCAPLKMDGDLMCFSDQMWTFTLSNSSWMRISQPQHGVYYTDCVVMDIYLLHFCLTNKLISSHSFSLCGNLLS